MSIRIVLVGTTHPGNIGAVARAMMNMGLSDLALVNPKKFPHKDAVARASGALGILDNARVVTTLKEALIDCVYVAGASARSRAIQWPTMAPRDCADGWSRNRSVAPLLPSSVPRKPVCTTTIWTCATHF